MGIAQRHAGDVVQPSADARGIAHGALHGQRTGQAGGAQIRNAHVHGHGGDAAVARVDLQSFHAAGGFDGQAVALNDAVVVEVLRHAADAVAGHAALGAIAVEHGHLRVGRVRMLDERDAVRAHTVVGAAEPDAQGLGIDQRAGAVVDDDVVVAGGLHLGKAQPAALPAHVVDVHQLGVHLVVAAGDDVGQRVGRVQ